MSRDFCLGAVILAAGRSVRMGRPKLLLPWGPGSILSHLLGQWRGLGAEQVAVVCATGDAALEQELARLGFPCQNVIWNPTPDRGMFSSVQCAARWPGWHSGLTHWCIALGDQPHLRPRTLRGLLRLARSRRNNICQPSWQGRKRHPVVLPRSVFEQLARTEAQNLKAFLEPSEIAQFEADDPGLALDIDRPEDYENALRLHETRWRDKRT